MHSVTACFLPFCSFYSAYLVADYVEVITRHPDDVQLIWESAAEGSFAISEDKDGEPLVRGTRIDLHLKKGNKKYLEDSTLRELVQRYSEFINFPISLLVERTIEREVEITEETTTTTTEDKEKDADSTDGTVVEEEEEEEKSKTKTVKDTVREWETLNEAKALWLRSPGNVSEEEHEKFYQTLAKSRDAPLTHTHFRAEGDVEFKSVLYVCSSCSDRHVKVGFE